MLVSAVIKVRPVAEGQIPIGSGRAVQALFYEWLTKVNPVLAEKLHDSNQVKPFSVSSLNGLGRSGGGPGPGERGEGGRIW
jgi:CRISPR/Cas system endoribonuclease Cas6 (RAMP superfamily)